MLTVRFVMPTTHAGDLNFGSTSCPTEAHAQMVIRMHKIQHPEFSKRMRYEIEARDDNGNLTRRIFG